MHVQGNKFLTFFFAFSTVMYSLHTMYRLQLEVVSRKNSLPFGPNHMTFVNGTSESVPTFSSFKLCFHYQLQFYEYRISLIRRRGYYIFQHAGPRGDCSRVAFTRGRRLLEGGGNKFQVPVKLSYFGKESLHNTRL